MPLTLMELLTTLRSLDVELAADGDRVRCRARRGTLTPELQADLKRLKPELLEFLRRAQQTVRTGGDVLRKASRSGPLPASFGQQRLWFLQELDPGSYAYNLPGAVRVNGPLDVAALERALEAIVERHEILRTTFRFADGGLLQLIGSGQPVHLQPLDLSDVPRNLQDARVQDYLHQEFYRPFDLRTGPHWRVSLLYLGLEEHILVIVQHHIISDGWSLGIFVHEIGRLYEAFIAGRVSPLAPLPIQYADYAAWQRQTLQGEGLAQALTYWKLQLAAPLPMLDLPTDRPRPPLQSLHGAIQPTLVPKPLAEAVRAFSHREGATLFMMLLAAFKVLLCRYTGQTDLVVGTSNGNRSHAETESLIGFFVNTLALRTDISGNPTFRELLDRVRRVAVDAYEHQDVPFERLVEELRPVRDLSRSPIFQVMFTLHNAPTERLELQSLTLSGVECDNETSKFDLTLSVTDVHAGLAAVLEYNTDLFDLTTIRRWLAHWQCILEHAVAHPETRISEFPLHSAAERRRLLVEWNQTEIPFSENATLVDLFARQVARDPCAVAVVAGSQSLTRGALDELSSRLARKLRDAGARRGTVVGICAERSVNLVAGLLAILKSGAAYLPFDIELPRGRLQAVLDDARPAVMLLDHRAAAQFPDELLTRVELEADTIPTTSSAAPLPRSRPNDPAYLIYTSGSTGKPNGTLVPQRAMVNFLEDMQREPGLAPDDVLLAVTPITFDISVLELFLPLVTGARVVIADRETARDPARLSRLLEETSATVMQATPATWRMLIESGWQGNPAMRLLCGGEELTRDLANRLLERCGALWNLYGPTETTVWSSRQRVTAGEGAVSIGRPIANTRIYLLDADLQPVPVGARGELYIGGEGLAFGYPYRPGLTAERFVPDPFSREPGNRLYRTGDVARYLPGGRIEYLGRLDFQVKVRGVRIELGEIETILRKHPAVREAVVVASMLDVGREKSLVAYVVRREEPAAGSAELRTLLEEQLPPQMLPAAYVFLDALPLTAAGKIDRRALPAPGLERPALLHSYRAPRNATEEKVHEIWTDVLPLMQIGIDDNFFDLGGHSLLLVQVRERLVQALHAEISVVDLFRLPTIAAIAAQLDGAGPVRNTLTAAEQRGAAQRTATAD